jgi:glycerol-3-phosphate acyltransferase PlsY
LTWEISIVVGTYLLGSIPSALFVVWIMTGKDVRRLGSGNVGATNATRVAGVRAGILVTILDVAKGAVPVWFMEMFNPSSVWLAATVLAAVVGHCFPVWLKFRGGKGVATGFGAFLVLSPWAGMAALGAWILVLGIGRWVSLASMAASAAFPLLLVLIDTPNPVILGAVSGVATLIVVRHHSNIRLLLTGHEPKIGKWSGGDS